MEQKKRTAFLILSALSGDPSASADTQTTETASILNSYQWRQYTIAYEIDPDYPDYNVNAKHADADSILICIKIKL